MTSPRNPQRRVSKGSYGETEGTRGSPPGVVGAARNDGAERVANSGEGQPPDRGSSPSPLGTIRGRVVTRQQEPLSEATVAISAGITHRDIAALTDSQGSFVLSGLLPGEYKVSAHVPGYPAQTKSAVLGPDQVVIVDFQFDK